MRVFFAGYSVHAISGKPEQSDYLKCIGVAEALGREVLATLRPRRLEAPASGDDLFTLGARYHKLMGMGAGALLLAGQSSDLLLFLVAINQG